jgi:hypothetical protein
MRRGLFLLLGVLAVLVGVVWTLQGIGELGGSAMTGVRVWAVVGPIVALAGLVLIGIGFRRRRNGSGQPGPPGAG